MDTPYVIEHRKRVDSTQDIARSLAESSLGNALVTADEQVAGRGRSGNSWWQADTNLFMSLAFWPVWSAQTWGRIPLIVGNAVADTIDELLGVNVGLKWPNDILIDDDKVGGILVEAKDGVVVAGCGINLSWANPPAGAAGIVVLTTAETRNRLATGIADRVLGVLAGDADSWPLTRYKARCVTLGEQVTWQGGGPAEAVDVLTTGELLVRVTGGDMPLVASEVRHVRAATLSRDDSEH
ncbi:bifunctional ligase/repressor BirA [bacterium BMS3Bbin02]|nr:bifunctional ligase/repressor BirA [bacterium BMS3Bbin02]